MSTKTPIYTKILNAWCVVGLVMILCGASHNNVQIYCMGVGFGLASALIEYLIRKYI